MSEPCWDKPFCEAMVRYTGGVEKRCGHFATEDGLCPAHLRVQRTRGIRRVPHWPGYNYLTPFYQALKKEEEDRAKFS